MIQTIHRAKFVLVDSDLLLRDAALDVSDPGRISRVEPWQGAHPRRETRIIDWGSSVIIPGLVNAHTHFELTGLHNKLTGAGSFTQWLSGIINSRRDWTREQYVESIRKGARMALASGTTLAGDISASGLSSVALAGTRIRRVVFEETLGLAADSALAGIRSLESRIESAGPDSLTVSGVSPHAPYSVAPDLYRAIAGFAQRRGLPVATHLAETRAELEFLQSGTGEFRDFLTALGVLPEGWEPPRVSPVGYLESLKVLHISPLLIHCNYLDPASIAPILSHRCSVVYCPRSHAFFGHGEHPARRLLDAGINVALGTDSLASNDSLSMLDEIRFLYRTRKDLKCDEIFRMATINGAAALGLGRAAGRLRRGAWADMAVLEVPGSFEGKNLTAQLLEGMGECVATIVGGEVAWSRASDLQSQTTVCE